MTSDEAIAAIKAERYGVVMFYGPQDFTPEDNFFFALLPKRGVMHVQWHRDIMPALKRFLRAKYNKSLKQLVTGTDGYQDGEGLEFLRIRAAGKNERLWVAFEWEGDGEVQGVFKEIEFNKDL